MSGAEYIGHVQKANAAFLRSLDALPTPMRTGDQDRADAESETALAEAEAARRIRESR